jgi:hypothetical protein
MSGSAMLGCRSYPWTRRGAVAARHQAYAARLLTGDGDAGLEDGARARETDARRRRSKRRVRGGRR